MKKTINNERNSSMNKNNYSPYGNFSYEKIDAPKKVSGGVKGSKKTATRDLRGGKKNGRA